MESTYEDYVAECRAIDAMLFADGAEEDYCQLAHDEAAAAWLDLED